MLLLSDAGTVDRCRQSPPYTLYHQKQKKANHVLSTQHTTASPVTPSYLYVRQPHGPQLQLPPARQHLGRCSIGHTTLPCCPQAQPELTPRCCSLQEDLTQLCCQQQRGTSSTQGPAEGPPAGQGGRQVCAALLNTARDQVDLGFGGKAGVAGRILKLLFGGRQAG